MEKYISQIYLTVEQANKLVDEYYPNHYDFSCPIEERSLTEGDFVMTEMYTQQRANLINILTARVGTEYEVERHFGRGRSVGYTTIKPIQGDNNHITGFRDQSCEHIGIALCFLKAETYRWFESKYPVKTKREYTLIKKQKQNNMQTGNFRIVFFVNFIEIPFIWQGFDGISNFDRASQLANLLAKFDLGRANSEEIDAIHGGAMIASYKAYRRKHGINHPDLISASDMSIDQFDGENWWIVSEDLDTIEYEIGDIEAYSPDTVE